MKKLSDIQEMAVGLIEEERDNLRMMGAMDEMDQLSWQMPPELEALSWVRQEISSDPHDALRDGVRLFSSHVPKLRYTPVGPSDDDRDTAEMIERVLMWHYEGAANRRGPVTSIIMKDAIKYARTAVQVVYLPNQFSVAGNISEKRRQAALRHGNFAIIPRSPHGVFPQWSDLMLEGVLHRRITTVKEVIEFWGDKAKKLASEVKKKRASDLEYVTVFDYCDFDQRTVWVVLQNNDTTPAQPGDDSFVLMDEENPLDFLPWVVKDDGRILQPLLYSIYKADQWGTQNLLESLSMSEIIAYSAAPRMKKTGPNPDAIEVNYGDPARSIDVPLGSDVQSLPPPSMDQNLSLMSDRIKARMSKSTLPNLIQSVDVPSGSAFASIREMIQLGVKALTPYKVLAEATLADIYRQMLYWVDESGDNLESYSQATDDTNTTQYVVTPQDFDVRNLYVRVELTADLPIDKVAQMNAASMGRQNLNLSAYTAMDMVGIDDPGTEKRRKYAEEMQDMEHSLQLNQMQFGQQMQQQQAQFEMQMQQQQQAMEMQQQAAQQQQAQQQGAQPGGAAALRAPAVQQQFAQNRGNGFENAGGQGFNPAAGGQPPATANPGGTRETQQQRNSRGPAISAGNEGVQGATPRRRG